MKKFLEALKAIATSAAAWFNRWPKDLILHFTLADNIHASAWIVAATIGMFAPIKWVYAISAALTLALIIIKDCVLDAEADWHDIAAGIIGLIWSQLKIWLICVCWLAAR